MSARSLAHLATAAALAIAFSACGNDGSTISGAGATFPQPVYDQWAADVRQKESFTVNYNPVGSGGGIAQFTAGTVAFGATDTAMDDEELKAAERRGVPLHIPTVFGSVTVAYNLPGVGSGLRLDGPTLAEIFQGRITHWNDSAIARLNPRQKLPPTRITVVHRADESGTTKLFTSYLGDYSDSWKNEVGVAKSVKWPVGIGAAKNAGVSGGIKQTKGAIGYLELAYAIQSRFAMAALKNSSGRFVTASRESATAAGEGLDLPDDLRFSAINSPNAAAYPISSATFILVYLDMCRAGSKPLAAANTKRYLEYGLGDGQNVARRLGFAPLPANLLKLTRARVAGLLCDGRRIS